MSFLVQTSGTWVNVATVLVGGSLGLLLRNRLPERVVTTLMHAIGLTTIFVGVSSAWDLNQVTSPPGVIAALIALALGGIMGEVLRIDDRLTRLGEALKTRFSGDGAFVEGFVTATLLFCVGPLTLVGALQNGLAGDPSFLLLKSVLDGLSALALAASFGWGVLGSTVIILIYQGGVSLSAGALAQTLVDPASDPRVLLVNGAGGLMILGLGFGLLGLIRIRVANLLPALLLIVPIWLALGLLW